MATEEGLEEQLIVKMKKQDIAMGEDSRAIDTRFEIEVPQSITGERIRQARSEYVEELVATTGSHFHVLIVTFSNEYLNQEPRLSHDGKSAFVTNPAFAGHYTEHSLFGTNLADIVRMARRLGGPHQPGFAIFRILHVEDGMCHVGTKPVSSFG